MSLRHLFSPRLRGSLLLGSLLVASSFTTQAAEELLRKEHVAVVPGNAFGDCGEGFLRVSYSYSLNHITEALSRIQRFLKERGSN